MTALRPGTVIEVANATLRTFDGEELEVHGGVYLSPDAYLAEAAEKERLKRHEAQLAERSSLVPALVVGAALLGVAAGFWFGRRGDE
jgi:hypothetical protein